MASAALVAPKGLMSTAGPLFSQLNTWLSRPAHTVKEPKHLAGVLAVAEAACAQEPPLLMGAGWRIGPARALRRLFKAIARHPLLAPAWADSPYYARIIQVALTCMSGDATFEVICRVLCRVERGEVAGEQFLRLIDPVRAWPRVPANTVYVARHVRSGMCTATTVAAMEAMRSSGAGAGAIAASWARLLRSELMRLDSSLSRQVIEACTQSGVNVFRCDGACVCRGHGTREIADTLAPPHFVDFVTEVAKVLSLGAPRTALLVTIPGTLDRLGLTTAWRALEPAEMDQLLDGVLRRMAAHQKQPNASECMAAIFFVISLSFWAERVTAHGPSRHLDLMMFHGALRSMCDVEVVPAGAATVALAALPGATAALGCPTASRLAARQLVLSQTVAGPIGHPQLAALVSAAVVSPWLAGVPVDLAAADTAFLRAMVKPRRPLLGRALLTAGVFAGYVVAEREDSAAARTAALAMARSRNQGGRVALPRELSDIVLAIFVAPWSRCGGDRVRANPWGATETLARRALPPHD